MKIYTKLVIKILDTLFAMNKVSNTYVLRVYELIQNKIMQLNCSNSHPNLLNHKSIKLTDVHDLQELKICELK